MAPLVARTISASSVSTVSIDTVAPAHGFLVLPVHPFYDRPRLFHVFEARLPVPHVLLGVHDTFVTYAGSSMLNLVGRLKGGRKASMAA